MSKIKNHIVKTVLFKVGVPDKNGFIHSKESLRKLIIINKSPIGRGVQSNTGARLASGEILIFLHADTLFAKYGFGVLDKAFENPKVKIGTLY